MIRRWVLVLFYFVVAALTLNSLVTHFDTALPGTVHIQASNQIQPSEFDIFAWDLWWVRYSIFDLHVSPLYTNYVVYPFTSPLAGHTLLLTWGLLSAPLQAWLGMTPTYNLIIVLCFAAAAAFMYLFARRHVQHESVAWLAGLIFAFTPAMRDRASVGHLNNLSIFWLPLGLLVWDQVVKSRRWTWAMALGVCLYFSMLTDFQQTMWTLCLLVPYALYGIVTHHKEREPGPRLEWLAAIALVTLIIPALIAPIPQLIEAKRLNYPPARLDLAAYFAFLPKYFFSPSENGDFSIGALLPALTLVAVPFIRRDGRRWLWLGIALSCFILALGPFWKLGTTTIPLPYTLVHTLLGNQYRTPMRFATPGVLALAMLAALTLDWGMTRLRRTARWNWLLIGGLSLVFIFDYRLLRPFPITQMPDYQIYHALANEPDKSALLEIPIAVRTGLAIVGRGEYLQYYQTIHHRPIPTGYLSRIPSEITDFFFFDPLIGAFSLSQALPGDTDARLSQLIRDWKIGYVILHRDMLEPDRVVWFGDVLNRQSALERVGEEGPLVIYRAKAGL